MSVALLALGLFFALHLRNDLYPAKFLFKTIFFRSFEFTAKLRGMYRHFPHAPYPRACIASAVINITHQNGTLVTKDEPTLMVYKHLKSRAYLRAPSWCTFLWVWTSI